MNYLSSIMVAEICRNIKGNCIIVVGGMHASAVPDDFIYNSSPFDFIVIGEGKKTLLKICQGKIKRTGKPIKIIGEPIDLRDIPTPKFKDYRYLHFQGHHTLLYALSRGCPFSCSFCIESIKSGPDYRCLPIKRVEREIQEVTHCLSIKKIKFADPCFGLRKEWRKKFLESLIKMETKYIFEFETRVDLLNKEDIDLISKLNIQYLYLGLEHASPKMLSLMQKTEDPLGYLEKAKKIISYLNEKDIPNKLLLIFNHPGETKESIRETIQFLDSIFSKLKNISTVLAPQNYFLTPGTRTYCNIREYEKEFGTIVKYKTWWKEPYFDQHDLATDILPSKDFYDGTARDYWKKDIYEMQRMCISRRSKNFLAFDMASRIMLGDKKADLESNI